MSSAPHGVTLQTKATEFLCLLVFEKWYQAVATQIRPVSRINSLLVRASSGKVSVIIMRQNNSSLFLFNLEFLCRSHLHSSLFICNFYFISIFIFLILTIYLYWKIESVITKEVLFSHSELRCTRKSKMCGTRLHVAKQHTTGVAAMSTQWQVNMWPLPLQVTVPYLSLCGYLHICCCINDFMQQVYFHTCFSRSDGCFWFEHHQDCGTTEKVQFTGQVITLQNIQPCYSMTVKDEYQTTYEFLPLWHKKGPESGHFVRA